MEDIDKEISEMKISLNARARIVAEEFLKNVMLILNHMSTACVFILLFFLLYSFNGGGFFVIHSYF